jgi:hypothetical protein
MKAAALIVPAEAAGIKVPADVFSYNHKEYLAWALFCNASNDMIMPYCEWHNAVVIAKLTKSQVENATWAELCAAGWKGH